MSEHIIEIPDYTSPFDPVARTVSLGERIGWWCHRWNTDMVKPDGFCAWGETEEGEI